jgi:hypothetical protein
MTEPKFTKAHSKSRPRSKAFLSIDRKNAYARLGVSPLSSADEIAQRIADLRGKAVRRAKAKTERSVGEEEEEIYRLDNIHNEIGTPKGRKKYDEEHPQNILLTVQPSPAEQSWLRYRKSGLISEWLSEELGQDAFVPSLGCLQLWSPGGLPEQLLLFLSEFTLDEHSHTEAVEQSAHAGEEGPRLRVSPDELEHLIKEKEDV